MRGLGAIGLIAAGGAIMFFAGAILAAIVSGITYSFGLGTWWWTVFVLYWAVVVPLLIREVRRRSEHAIADRAVSIGDPLESDSFGEYHLKRTQFQAALVADALLWGPRAVVSGIIILRGNESIAQLQRFGLATVILNQLLQTGTGVEIRKLDVPNATAETILDTLDWLDRHDYIGRSSDGKRVWINSDFQKRLREAGVI